MDGLHLRVNLFDFLPSAENLLLASELCQKWTTKEL